MNRINMLASILAQRAEDTGKQISALLVLLNSVIARMTVMSASYYALAHNFGAQIVWDSGIALPQIFEQHQKARRFYDTMSAAAFILSLVYLIVGCYFSITEDPMYVLIIFGIALGIGLLWHYVIRVISYRIFKLVPEKSEECRIRGGEITAVGCAVVGFIGALIFAIGRALGDEEGLLADYFVESLFVADACLLTASGVAHAVADFYRWSESQTHSYEKDRQELFRLNEKISRLAALLLRDLRQFNGIDEAARPPLTLSAEVIEVVRHHENGVNANALASLVTRTDENQNKELLSENKNGEDVKEL